jgi:hypothetical protein
MAVTLPNTSLSANDARILNAIFDPETLPSSVGQQKETSSSIDPSLPAHPSIPTSLLTSLERQQSDIIARTSSTSSIVEIDAAIEELDRVVEQYPEYAGAWVNRAMVRRMKLEANLEVGKNIFQNATETLGSDVESVFCASDSSFLNILFYASGVSSRRKGPSDSLLTPRVSLSEGCGVRIAVEGDDDI